MRRQYAMEQDRGQRELMALKKQIEELQAVREDYSTLESLLEQHPDLAAQLEERAGQGRTAPATPATAALPPEYAALNQKVDKVLGWIEGQQRSTQTAQQQQENQEVDRELTGVLGKLLTERKLDPEWLPHVRAFVLQKAKEWPDLDLEDVPHVFVEWYRPMHGLLSKQLNAWKSGKASDMLLAPAPSGAPVVNGAKRATAFGGETNRALADLLASRGWNNQPRE
jgi:hypothetical protein